MSAERPKGVIVSLGEPLVELMRSEVGSASLRPVRFAGVGGADSGVDARFS